MASFTAKVSAAICLLATVSTVHAGPAAAPNPVITPAPQLLARDTLQTLGWYSSGSSGTQPLWSAWDYDSDTATFTSSGNFFRRCPASSSCTWFTGCSSGWMVGPTATSWCGFSTMTLPASRSSFCGYHSLLPSQGATSGGQKWYWCDVPPLQGLTIYQKAPAGVVATTTSASSPTGRSSGASNPTTGRSASATSTSSPSPTPVNPDNPSKAPIAAIIGGVVGGIAILGLLAFAIFFVMRRDKKKKAIAGTNYQAAPLMGGATAYQPSSAFASQAEFYAPGSESKPQGQASSYYAQSYPLGPYDPHLGPQPYPPSAYSGGPAELGAPLGPQFPPQELPGNPVVKK